MICIRCGEKFIETPKHKAKWGVVIQSRAKLCPNCRHKARVNKGINNVYK